MPRASASLAVALVAALASSAWAAAPGSDGTALLQSLFSEVPPKDESRAVDEGPADEEAQAVDVGEELGDGPAVDVRRLRSWKFDVGDHVLISPDDSATPLKASITAVNEADGTYNVHLWTAAPHKREMHNVPADIVADARPQERAEADKVSRMLLEQQVLEEERKAVAKQQKIDQQLAEDAAEAARREAEIYAKEHKEEIAHKAAQEAIKNARAKAIQDARRRKMLEREKEQRKKDEAFARTHTKITMVGRHRKRAEFVLERHTQLRAMLDEVCEKFHLKLSETNFFYKGELVKPTDSPHILRMGSAADIVLGLKRRQE